MVDKNMITTAVDDLMHLVKESGKISVMDAAKRLNVPQKTVETWVDFLVEEERLSIEYKFTTPYIFLNKDFADEEEELSISKEDFETEIKREEITVDEGEGKFHEYVTRIINQFKNIQLVITQKKLDQAYEQYDQLSEDINALPKSELANIFNRNLIKLNYGLLLLYKEHLKKSEEIIKQIIELEKKGAAFVHQEEVEPAKKTYLEMKKLYDAIPLMLVDPREEIYDYIYRFFKSIIAKEKTMTERLRQDVDVKIKHIKSEINKLLHENRVKEAEKHLISLKEIYYSLPPELISYKLLVYNDILRTYEEVSIAGRFEVLKSELDQLGSEIKLPPLAELMRSPISSAVDAPFDHHAGSSSALGSPAQQAQPGIPPANSGKNNEVENGLSLLPKVGATPTGKPGERTPITPPEKAIPEQTADEHKLPSPADKPSMPPAPGSEQPKPFESISSDSFSTLLSKENPNMKAAAVAYNAKDYAKAKQLFETVLQEDPGNYKAKQMLTLVEGLIASGDNGISPTAKTQVQSS